MIFIRGPDQTRSIVDPAIHDLVEQRFAQVCNGEPYDYDSHGEVIVVEPGDTVAALDVNGRPTLTSDRRPTLTMPWGGFRGLDPGSALGFH